MAGDALIKAKLAEYSRSAAANRCFRNKRSASGSKLDDDMSAKSAFIIELINLFTHRYSLPLSRQNCAAPLATSPSDGMFLPSLS